jgi:hypothetical protein
MSTFPEENRQTLLAAIIAFILTPAGFTLLGAGLVVSGGVAAWTYNVGKDIGISAAANYSTADRLKLDKLADDARTAASELRQATSRFIELSNADESLKSLKKQYDERVSELTALNSEKVTIENRLRATVTELSEARSALSKIVLGGNSYVIPSNKAVMIADENLFATVSNYQYVSSAYRISILLNGVPTDVYVGDNFETKGLKSPKCIVFVKEFDRTNVLLNVSITCS